MFRTKAFEIVNKKGIKGILAPFVEAVVLFACVCGFLLLYFSVFDKEYDPVYVRTGVEAGLVLGVLTFILKRHKIAALILNIICIYAVIYMNFEFMRESLIQIVNFIRTRAYFSLDTEVYSLFLEIFFFAFTALLAYFQNLRLSFIPMFLFLGGATAYLVIFSKPYDMNIYILYIILALSSAAYSLSAGTSVFAGLAAFVCFGLASVFVVNCLREYINEDNYKEIRGESEFLAELDNTEFMRSLYPDVNISALTNGQILSYTLNGMISKQLMFIITVSDFKNDFCLTSYKGDVYNGSGWAGLSNEQKASLPESSPEEIEKEIISADLGGQNILFSGSEVEYSIEKSQSVAVSFTPYFSFSENGFYELSAGYLSVYDLTPERVSGALYAGLSWEEAESLISREESYREFVHENYLDVPEGIKEKLAGDYGDLTETVYTSQLINDLKTRLNENTAFTITPEAVPEGEDPVEFTLEQGEADSNRLASVGIMALRYLGLPARYAEGAVISPEAKESSPKVGDKYKIDVYNLDAGAYGEVYIDGFGWLPVNFLPDDADKLAEEQIDSLNNRETTDLDAVVKAAVMPHIKKAAKAAAEIASAACALFVVFLIVRRYAIIALRNARLCSSGEKKRKETLYKYTEDAKAFFNENIFESCELNDRLNEYFYSRSSKYEPYKLYKETKTVVKNRLKTSGIFKRFKAFAFKII